MRTCTRARTARRGFTLIELLVVISIIATLTGLVLAGISRVRAVQMQKTAENTLSKLQLALDQQWKAVLDQVKQDKLNGKIPGPVLTLCENDPDRAEALWAYANLKREFPETIAEATTTINLNGYLLTPRTTFASLGSASVGGADDQAAVLLYAILTNKSSRGMVASLGDSGTAAQAKHPTLGFQVFMDGWGTPITFRRFFGADNSLFNNTSLQITEVQNPPYVNKKAGVISYDPLDPRVKLAGNWANPNNKTAAQVAVGTVFNGQNRLITVVSAGPNKTYETMNITTGDDLYGFRLLRAGNRGD